MGKVMGMILRLVRPGSTPYPLRYLIFSPVEKQIGGLFFSKDEEVTMNNNTTPATKKQERPYGENANNFTLDTVSLAAFAPFSEAVFMLADNPIQTLSRLYKYLQFLYEQKREQESVDMLYIIYDVLGIEYADAIKLLRGDTEARGNFLYGFIANLGEFIEELTERGGT
jgi:hypothetical protein